MEMAHAILHPPLQEIRHISEYDFQFNIHQCKYLQSRCSVVEEFVALWSRCTQLELLHLAAEELACVLCRALELLKQCQSEKWLYHAAVRVTNSRAFAEICLSLSRLTALINAHLIHSAADLKNQQVQQLMAMSHKHKQLEDLMRELRPCTVADRNELTVRADSIEEDDGLARYLVEKLMSSESGALPTVQALERRTLIGAGAFGCVYRAEWEGSPVAVKEFRKGDTSFDKEVKILKELLLEPHPRVLQMIGYYQEDEKAYLVMELMESDLANVIRKAESPMRLPTAVDIMLQIASGMRYLHDRNVVHRDLKPSNVLVETRRHGSGTCFNVRLTDFGVSKSNFISFAPDLSYQRGTIQYMAPEMLRGQTYSREVDVYSFGVTCFQILTGTLPFQSQHLVADKLVQVIENGNRPDLPTDCPMELVALLNRCWNRNPKDRPSFEQISTTLWSLKERLLGGQSLEYTFTSGDVCADELRLAAGDLTYKISIAVPFMNLHQCYYLQSRCKQISSYREVSDKPVAGAWFAVKTKLVNSLRTALALIESNSEEKWLETGVSKAHNSLAFLKVVNDISRCENVLRGNRSGGNVLGFLNQYAEDDMGKMVAAATNLIAASEGKKCKLAHYLVQKIVDPILPCIEPEDIVLHNLLGMSNHGTIFRGKWLDIPVTLKSLGTGSEADKLLKEFERYYTELAPHPNVIQLFGFTRHGENLHLVLEHISGGPFRLTKFPLVLTMEILVQLAEGIAHLHENNFHQGDLHTLLVEFEKSLPDKFTGGITVKLSADASSFFRKRDEHNTFAGKFRRPFIVPNVAAAGGDFRKIDAFKFGIACVEMITGQTIGEEILLSGKVPQLPPDCGVKSVVERCLSSQPPGFNQIAEILRVAQLRMQIAPTSDIDYRRMLLDSSAAQTGKIDISGDAVIGGKLIVVGDVEDVPNRLYQWIRQHRDGTIERLRPFLVTGSDSTKLEYTLTADDFNKAIALTYVDMNEKIEISGRETTNSRWVSYSDAMKRGLKMIWEVGEGKFKVMQIREEGGNKKGYLVIRKSGCVLQWRQYVVKKVELMIASPSSAAAAAAIRICEDQPGVCQLIDSGGQEACKIRFKDAFSRDLAVLTFRHFMQKGSKKSRRG